MSLDPLMTTIDTLTLNLANAEQEVKDLKAKLEKIEVQRRMYPIQDGPSVPWEVMAPHEAQCQRNHDQSISRIAERGGFGCSEAWCVVNGIGWVEMEKTIGHPEAKRRWIEYAERINLHYDELATLRATAQSLRDLLKRCEWKVRKSASTMGYCSFCDGIEPDHKTTCALAAELKATP